ncbi:MAG: hypothetical protein K2Y18_05615 [Alphaproteobacteria bacterium]|nr:hypothetical protein [Alphaproteobacteria bacterium]
MNKKLFTAFGIVLGIAILLCSCSTENQVVDEQIVYFSPPPPLSQPQLSKGTVLKKRILPNNEEEYRVRLDSGLETSFTVGTPAYYQIGDKVIVPGA